MDYRIEFLADVDGTTIHHVNDFRSASGKTKSRSQSMSVGAIERFGYSLPTEWPKLMWDKWVPDTVDQPTFPDPAVILDDLDAGEETIVATDRPALASHPIGKFMDELVTESKRRGYPTLSLPHGDAGLSNYLTHGVVMEMYDYDFSGMSLEQVVDARPKASGYDYYVLPNVLMSRILGHDNSVILGSPRYNNEWIEIASELSPTYDAPTETSDCNVLFFIPKRTVPVHWEEVYQTIKIVGNIPGVNVVVKGHPRSSYRQIEGLSATSGATVSVENEQHSISLLKWADAVMGLGSSIVFEAIVRDLPVLVPEYLHPNRSTVAERLETTQADSRDDVYEMVDGVRTGDRDRTYSERDRKRFIDDLLNGPTDDVLGGYANFVHGTFEREK